jgi:hypothetical protein
MVKVISAGVASPAAQRYVPGATSSLTPGNSVTPTEAAGDATAVGLVVRLVAGVAAGLAEAGVSLETTGPVVQAVTNRTMTRTRAVPGDADQPNGRFISILLSVCVTRPTR